MLGSLVAAPLAMVVGLTGAIVGTGVLAAGYAAVVALPQRAPGRHRAVRAAALLPEAAAA